MKDTVYLVANDEGILRMTKRPPTLNREEIGVSVRIAIPDSCFRSPLVSVSIDVPADRVIIPSIEAEVLDPPPQEPTPC